MVNRSNIWVHYVDSMDDLVKIYRVIKNKRLYVLPGGWGFVY
jgi:hypothetical protein